MSQDRPDENTPQLACIVLGVGRQRGLARAVASLLNQGAPVEIVVVSSGGGVARQTLEHDGLRVPVIEVPERLYPGAARNRGIRATRAPYIAFLAGDDAARPGWAAGRIACHRAGASAVSCALVPVQRWNPIAFASYLLLYRRRMPSTPPAERLHYGVSYDRSLFDRYGLFREELRSGEDSDFNSRLPAGSVTWGEGVWTATDRPANPASLFLDQVRRGQRMARAVRELHGRGAVRQVAGNALRNVRPAARAGWREAGPGRRLLLPLTWAILPFAAAAYAAGAATEPLTPWRRR